MQKGHDLFGRAMTFAGEWHTCFSILVKTYRAGLLRTEAFRRSRACFHRFDCAIAWLRVGYKRIKQMMRGMHDFIDRAIECLEKCYEEHSHWLIYLHIDPSMDGLRDDPSFQELLRRVGLPALTAAMCA